MRPRLSPRPVVVAAAVGAATCLGPPADGQPARPAIRLGAPAACLTDAGCAGGLGAYYGLSAAAVLTPSSGVQALDDGTAEVAIVARSDPRVARRDLIVLRDDRGMIGPENPVPTVRRGTLRALGRQTAALRRAVAAVSDRLGTRDLRELNQLALEGRMPETIAGDWIESHGLLDARPRRRPGPAIRFGYGAAPEHEIVTRLYQQALRSRGFRTRAVALAGPPSEAFRRRDVNAFVGGSRTLLRVLGPRSSANGAATVSIELAVAGARRGQDVFGAARAQSSLAFVMRRAVADRLGVASISDLRRYWPSAEPTRGSLSVPMRQITGTRLGDTLTGGAGADLIRGLGSGDRIDGRGGDDRLTGGTGNDVILGGGGADHAQGDSGNDRLQGGSGTDVLLGGSGDDRVSGASGDDLLEGGDGDDRLVGGLGDDFLGEPGAGNETLADGGPGDDLIATGHGADRNLRGGDGADVIFGGPGDDAIDGGPGSDHISAGMGQNLAAWVRGGGGDDVIYSGDGAARVSGDDGNDTIYGFGGEDEISGGAGDDAIVSGRSRDTVDCGDGSDIVWVSTQGEVDRTRGCESIVVPEPDPRDARQRQGDDPTYDTPYLDVARSLFAEWHNEGRRKAGSQGVRILATVYASASLMVCSMNKDRGCARGSDAAQLTIGTTGDDDIRARGGDDVVEGDPGDDRISGGSGDDDLFGRSGDDTIHGGSGDDEIEGGSGRDALYGDDGADQVNGGKDADRVRGGRGNDTIRAVGGGRDDIDCGPGRDRVQADSADRVVNCEVRLQ